MTVAAVILATPDQLDGADRGRPGRVRRLVDAAWAGGALPIVVVAEDPHGALGSELAGAPVLMAAPPSGRPGLGTAFARGVAVASAEVSGTDAAIAWPARMAWADPETITSLIEAHGPQPDALIRPAFRGAPGWPVLVPAAAAEERLLAPAVTLEALLETLRSGGHAELVIELGDPGTVVDGTVALADLPPYEGPPAPVTGVAHEWGAPAADEPDDAPLAGPSLAPYPQAANPED